MRACIIILYCQNEEVKESELKNNADVTLSVNCEYSNDFLQTSIN